MELDLGSGECVVGVWSGVEFGNARQALEGPRWGQRRLGGLPLADGHSGQTPPSH